MRATRATLLTAAVLLACVLSAVAPATAEDDLDALETAVLAAPADADTSFRLAGAYRAAGAVRRGVDFFTAFHAEHEPNPMSLVWQGSLKTLASADDGLGMEERLNLLQFGVGDMDRAVREFPDEVEVVMVRGMTISNFPSFLAMHGRAIRDLEGVLASGELEAGTEAAVRTALARAYRQAGREDDAERVSATVAAGAGE